MKTIDNTIKYYELLMKYDDTDVFKEYELPDGFHDFYDFFIDKLDKRCVFIVDSNTGEKVGTATISLLEEKECGYEAAVDLVAIKRSYQGRKLAKPLISKFMDIARNNGHTSLILHTQTNS